ncbi:MAG TPA: hypothetical protein PK122_00270 [Candidatus Paceibacterota bacterium]|nr:hypothetical protein [Candidatus Paceibacterota bacterium]
MSFTRGNDPKDSMELGRKKEALKISRIKIYTNGQETILLDPFVIEKFLERFSKFQIPNDPVFGPQRITFGCKEKYLDYQSSLAAALGSHSGLRTSSQDSPVEREAVIDRNILECEGKTAIFRGKMFAIPSLKEIRDNGFEHLEIIERNHQEELREKESEQHELFKIRMEHMKKMTEIFNPAIRVNTDQLIMVSPTEAAPIKEEAKKKKKKLWLFDIETR